MDTYNDPLWACLVLIDGERGYTTMNRAPAAAWLQQRVSQPRTEQANAEVLQLCSLSTTNLSSESVRKASRIFEVDADVQELPKPFGTSSRFRFWPRRRPESRATYRSQAALAGTPVGPFSGRLNPRCTANALPIPRLDPVTTAIRLRKVPYKLYRPASSTCLAIWRPNAMVSVGSCLASRRWMAICVRSMSPSATLAITLRDASSMRSKALLA